MYRAAASSPRVAGVLLIGRQATGRRPSWDPGVGQVGIPVTVRAVQIQVLPCERVPRPSVDCPPDHGREQLAVIAVTVVTQTSSRTSSKRSGCLPEDATVQLAVTVRRRLGGVVKLDDVAGCQNRVRPFSRTTN